MMTKKGKTIRAASYTRVSTAGQANEGLSLADQAERIRAFVEQQGWELVHEYEEAGKSGLKSYRTRPEFLRMISDAVAGEFGVLVVLDVTRFGRNAKEFFRVEDDLEQVGVGLVALEDPNYDKTDSSQVFGRGVKVLVGEFVALQSRAKSINVRHAKLDRGEYRLGQRIHYGLRWKDKKGTGLEHDPHDIQVWKLMKELRVLGHGYGRIAAMLNGQEDVPSDLTRKYTDVAFPVPNRFGKKIWREGAIASMFRDESRVTGKLTIRFKTLRGPIKVCVVDFPPMMTATEFAFCRDLAQKNLTWEPRNTGTGSVLSSLCRCDLCGASLHVTGGRGYGYYGCSNRLRPQNGHDRCSLPLIPKAELENAVLSRIADFLWHDEDFEAALAAAHVHIGDEKAALAKLAQEEDDLTDQRAQCDRQLARLVDAITDGAIGNADAKAKRQQIAKRAQRTDAKLADACVRRAMLERDTAHVAEVDVVRQKVRRQLGPVMDLVRLTEQEQQDFLRTLLPPGGDARIVVCVADKPWTPYPDEPVGFWFVEIDGILPVESAKLKSAVLGGALAVP